MKNQMKKSEALPFLPFALPDIGEEEIAKVVECMRSGWLTSGPNVREFEKQFAGYISNTPSPLRERDGVRGNNPNDKKNPHPNPLPEGEGAIEAIAVNSATSGLTLALEACGVGYDDEVITTPYTFSASAMSSVYLGATPVLVDIDPVTMNIDADLIEAAITPKTKAIVPVHFAGLACDMDKIISIAKKHNLKIVEDAAHALPCIYNGKKIGSLDTDAAVYSFYATKTITTGEGGMIVTNNPDIAKRVRTMRLHGISADVFDRYTSTKPKWYYEITAPGFKCNMTDIAASIGLPQLAKADEFRNKRAYIRNKYAEAFKDLPIILPVENLHSPLEGESARQSRAVGGKATSGSPHDSAATSGLASPTPPQGGSESYSLHSHHLFVIRLTKECGIERNDFINKMSEEYGIGCSVHFIPLNLHPFWQEKLGIDENSLPKAVEAYKNAVSLPIYTKMTDGDIDRVIEAVRSVILA